jgi:hypothetical protein
MDQIVSYPVMKENTFILPLCAFGNIFYYTLLLRFNCVIDLHENYPKQTWRNRYDILNAYGLHTLTIPVQGQKGEKISTAEIAIDNRLPWQRTHLRTIQAAYGSSPFYEHYIEMLEPLFTKPFERLSDFNQGALKIIIEELNHNISIQYSKQYITAAENQTDLRPHFKPSQFSGVKFPEIVYVQTFADRLGFVSNLSILDMLFNNGPDSARLIYQLELEATHFTIFDPQKNK